MILQKQPLLLLLCTQLPIYNYLNTTFRDNLQESKIRNLGYILGKTGTFVLANLGEYCEANDECSTNYCGNDGNWCWETCTTQCTTGEVGSLCSDNNQCVTGICGLGHCSDGAIGRECDNGSQCTSGYCGDTGWNYGAPTCTDGSAGQYCGGPDSCAPGNYCNPGDAICTATDGNLGSGCGQQSDCDAGLYCSQANYTCTDGSVGSSCSGGNQCSSGYCNTDFMECTTGAIGQGCGANGDCISAYCGYDGVQSFCTDGSIGSDCNQNAACVSGYCDVFNSQCSDGSIGSGCTNNNQCVSNSCDTYNDICKADRSIGSGCGQDSECDSLYCNESTNLCDNIILTSRLQGYWPLNETSGTTANDLSGKNRNGTIYNGALINQTGKVGTAFKFDGTNDYVGGISGISISGAFTLSFWSNITGTVSNADAVVKIYSGDINFHDSKPRVFASYDRIIANTAATKDVWQHWVVTRSPSNQLKIYLNSVLDVSSISGSFPFDPTYIARGAAGYFGGSLDEIAVWSRELSQDEITGLYNGGAGMSIITP